MNTGNPRTRSLYSLTFSITMLWGAAVAVASPGDTLAPEASVWARYKAKLVCSGVFVSGRKFEDVLKQDVAPWNYPTEVDYQQRLVRTRGKGETIVAVYRGRRLGCTLLPPGEVSLPQDLESSAIEDSRVSGDDWSIAEHLTEGTKSRLEDFLTHEFAENDPSRPLKFTRAIVVVHHGRIVAERYAEDLGITKDTPLLGWSMAKSVTSALAGVLVDRGRLALHAPLGFSEWKGDERSSITLDHLLRMGSGLDFEEVDTTNGLNDVHRLVLLSSDASAFMLSRAQMHEPGTAFNYSGGDTMLVSHLLRESLGQDEYQSFPWDALFNQIGMRSAVFEQDAAGTFMGATNLYATPRDWARFGLLYLREGVWNGERILSKDWVEYSRSITPYSGDKNYGAHFWRVSPEKARKLNIPEDAYLAAGFMGQATFIIPSKDLVVVRMGWTQDESHPESTGAYDPYALLQAITNLQIAYEGS